MEVTKVLWHAKIAQIFGTLASQQYFSLLVHFYLFLSNLECSKCSKSVKNRYFVGYFHIVSTPSLLLHARTHTRNYRLTGPCFCEPIWEADNRSVNSIAVISYTHTRTYRLIWPLFWNPFFGETDNRSIGWVIETAFFGVESRGKLMNRMLKYKIRWRLSRNR